MYRKVKLILTLLFKCGLKIPYHETLHKEYGLQPMYNGGAK